MKVHFTFTPDRLKAWEGQPYVERVQQMLATADGHRYTPVPRYEDADLIVFLEPNTDKDPQYVRMLRQQRALRERPECCFVFTYEPKPVPLLDGVYVSLPRKLADPHRYAAWCYVLSPNEWASELSERRDRDPQLMLSFRGAQSHPVRRRIFEVGPSWCTDAAITRTYGWYDHSEDVKREYLEEILDSRFVLCPRGIATSSHRLYEVMQLGRVPVILADDWVAPAGPDWESFSLWVEEDRVAEVPQIVAGHVDRWREMGMAARAAWEHWFSPERRAVVMLDRLAELQQRRTNEEGRQMLRRIDRYRFREQALWYRARAKWRGVRSDLHRWLQSVKS